MCGTLYFDSSKREICITCQGWLPKLELWPPTILLLLVYNSPQPKNQWKQRDVSYELYRWFFFFFQYTEFDSVMSQVNVIKAFSCAIWLWHFVSAAFFGPWVWKYYSQNSILLLPLKWSFFSPASSCKHFLSVVRADLSWCKQKCFPQKFRINRKRITGLWLRCSTIPIFPSMCCSRHWVLRSCRLFYFWAIMCWSHWII